MMFSDANHKFSIGSGGEVQSRPATEGEIANARSTFEIDMRSCWNCNPSHVRFLDDPAGHSFWCFECGRYYSDGVDVTDYGTEKEEAESTKTSNSEPDSSNSHEKTQ